MRIVAISDTHALHQQAFSNIALPEGDVLVHAGDLTNVGDFRDVESFAEFFAEVDYKHKIIIAGNHDFCFEREKLLAKSYLEKTGWHYLQDQEIVLDGVKFYGSPWQPEFFDWAFNLPRGERLAHVWAAIPDDTDVLITHGPAYGILDRVLPHKTSVGCEELLKRINQIKPKIHIFGHIHEDYGIKKVGETTFVNASICDPNYKPQNQPLVIDF